MRAGSALWLSSALLVAAGCSNSPGTRQSANAGGTPETPSAQTTTVAAGSAKAETYDGIRQQVEANWNTTPLQSDPLASKENVQIRLHLAPDGTVLRLEVMNDQPDNIHFCRLRDSAIRAIRQSSPLKLPPGKHYETAVLVFRPADLQ